MTILYLFCATLIIFHNYCSLIQSSIQYDQERYNQFKNDCKFLMPETLFGTSNQGTCIPESNKKYLKNLIRCITDYLNLINNYKILYQNETQHSSRYIISNNKLKEITNNIYQSRYKIKIEIIKVRSLFNGFEDIQPNIFDPLECSFNDLKKCFQTEHYTLFTEIQKKSQNLLKTIKYIEKQSKISTITNSTQTKGKPKTIHQTETSDYLKTFLNIFLITAFLIYLNHLCIISIE